jgi:hypothetical protein
MIAVTVDAGQLARLRKAVDGAGKKIPKELAMAVNKAAKGATVDISRRVRDKIVLAAKTTKESLKISGKATAERPQTTVTVKETKRLGLRHFKAQQVATGTTYKISKSGGKQLAVGAFQGPKPGIQKLSWKGNAFRRVGKARLPIMRLSGVSPYGVVKKNDMPPKIVEAINKRLLTEMERRIQFNVARAAGLNR